MRNIDLSLERITEAERTLQRQFGVAPNGKTELRMLNENGAPITMVD
jgi:hypothetical protein